MNVVNRVLRKLESDVYCYSKKIEGIQWMQEFLEEKMYSKYNYLESLGSSFAVILNSDTLKINNRLCTGIRKYFAKETIAKNLLPTSVSPIHGDLTLENILYDEKTDTFRLIDTSGSRYVDNKAMDTAKLLQSFLAKYETWDSRTDIEEYTPGMPYNLPEDLLRVSKEHFSFLFQGDEDAFKSSLLMLSCYFVRMTPFLLKKSEKHAMFALLLSTYYLSFTEA